MSKAEQDNSDLRLMELAARNPSLGGRALMLEIIERDPMPEENQRPQTHDIRDLRELKATRSGALHRKSGACVGMVILLKGGGQVITRDRRAAAGL